MKCSTMKIIKYIILYLLIRISPYISKNDFFKNLTVYYIFGNYFSGGYNSFFSAFPEENPKVRLRQWMLRHWRTAQKVPKFSNRRDPKTPSRITVLSRHNLYFYHSFIYCYSEIRKLLSVTSMDSN